MRRFSEVLSERASQLVRDRRRREAGETVHTFIPTGLRKWDANGGLERGILTVIAMESGGGKSLVKLHLMRSAALAGFSVLALDFEDPGGKTADRGIATATGLDSRDIGHLRFDALAEVQILTAATDASGWAGRVQHSASGLTAAQVRGALTDCPDADLVLLDYAQGVPEEGTRSYERTLSALAWDLQKDAEARNRCVVAFSQLGPDIEDRGADRAEWSRRQGREIDISGYRPGPGIRDLGWSKDLGRKAKEVVYGWRPGRWKKKYGVPGAKDDHIEFIKEKVNFGIEGRFTVRVDLPTARLTDWD